MEDETNAHPYRMIRHIQTCWISLQKVLIRVVEQFDRQSMLFRQSSNSKGRKHSIAPTER